ncbi:carbon-nitrogen family hydrolase [Clostridium neuense]|uniref:Carbon-nitrogen family hydrolase n=1 Tax=Clostridium neuense TaxID=1728934 RepID=A0ABW8TBV4_9CLOT
MFKLKIGLAQMNIVWENKEETEKRCIKFLEKASREKVDLLVFPEMTLTGFSMNVNKIGEKNLETVKWFSEKSKEYNLCIGFGFVDIKDNIGKNNFSICTPYLGEIARYTKIHPFSYGEEDKHYLKGEEIKYFNIGDINFSSFICYDLRFPEIFQAASKRSEAIIVIANWPEARREHWITLLKARAIENQCYICAVNRVGEGNGLYYSGDSMVIDPYGRVVCTSKDEEKLLTADISKDEVKNCREKFRFKQDRREELYKRLF